MCPLATKLRQTIFLLCSLFVVFFPVALVNAYSKHIDRFSHPDILYYKQLLFDVPNYKLLVGARDYIVTLGLEFDSSYKRVYYMPSDQTKQYNCQIKGMKKEQCHNFITALLPIQSNYREKQILVCGTNAYSPECELRPLSSMDTITSRSAPINSYSPTWNTTSLITTTGEFFYGGPLDLRGIDSSITRQQIALTATTKNTNPKDKRIIRSAQHDSKWINTDANFVHSFEYQSHVYFLFRESAVEYLNCGKRIYSRIGRVCKNDPGMVKAAATTWSSFLKSRLNCSIPGVFPFYFDEIQSVDFVESTGSPTLYAIFNTPENSIHGSAVCAFNIDSILDTFQGPFKYQKSSTHIWESTSDNRDAFECGASNNQSSSTYGYGLNSKTYQLMDRAVPSVNERPYVISKTEQFKFIAADVLNLRHHDSVEVLFVVTRDGKLMKYVRWPTLTEACLVDEIQLINPKEDQILSMKMLKDTLSLYFGTEKEVIRVSVHRCHVFHTKERCLASGDPYCGWSESKLKCTKAPGSNYKADGWIQPSSPQCASDHWGKWFACKQHDRSMNESCKCRKRPCSLLNSESCSDGYELEVTNCTQNGGWSDWSEWSQCSPSCGSGRRYRTRACTNPSPMFGGQLCQGPSREEQDCVDLPRCNWTPWSEWSNCSQVCTPELKRRTRKCVDFQGNLVDESFCLGTYVETSACDNCKKSEWTNWFIAEINDNEIIEQRNEAASHENNIMPKNEKRVITMKYCSKCEGYTYNFKDRDYLIKECGCSGVEEWSDWSEWSRCVNGSQTRYRSCMLTEKPCSGHYQESRYCSYHLMQSNVITFEPVVKGAQQQSNIMIILICVFISVIVSSCLTWTIATVINKRRVDDMGSGLGLMKHTISEPNTYEEPEKYRLNPSPLGVEPQARHATLTRSSTIKRDFSFRAKLDDSNYN